MRVTTGSLVPAIPPFKTLSVWFVEKPTINLKTKVHGAHHTNFKKHVNIGGMFSAMVKKSLCSELASFALYPKKLH